MRRSYFGHAVWASPCALSVWTGPGKARWALDKQSGQAPLSGETRTKRANMIGQYQHDRRIFLGLDRVALIKPS